MNMIIWAVFTTLFFSLACKYFQKAIVLIYTRSENFDCDKYSNFLGPFVTFEENKVFWIQSKGLKELLFHNITFGEVYRENSTPKDANFCSPRFSSFFGEKLPKSSGITHMVTSNGGHPRHHHLRHSVRLSNSLFNRRTTKPTFTQWPQASTL